MLITDHETLTITLNVTSISELGGQAIGTVRRNNTNISQPLVVSLSSNDSSEVIVDATVTIPAFATSATFVIDAKDDTLLETTQSVVITVSSPVMLRAVGLCK